MSPAGLAIDRGLYAGCTQRVTGDNVGRSVKGIAMEPVCNAFSFIARTFRFHKKAKTGGESPVFVEKSRCGNFQNRSWNWHRTPNCPLLVEVSKSLLLFAPTRDELLDCLLQKKMTSAVSFAASLLGTRK